MNFTERVFRAMTHLNIGACLAMAFWVLWSGLALAQPGGSQAFGSPETAAIRQVLMSQFDRPASPLTVEPIVVRGPNAIAGWAQGDRGGRALLALQGGQWQITLCAGDALKTPALLQEAGLSAADAQALARSLAQAEAALPADRVARLSRFDGVLRMQADGQHPTPHDAGASTSHGGATPNQPQQPHQPHTH